MKLVLEDKCWSVRVWVQDTMCGTLEAVDLKTEIFTATIHTSFKVTKETPR